MSVFLNIPIILASTSPRRIDLMKQVGCEVRVVPPDADETPRRGEPPRDLVKRLSRTKAESVVHQVQPGEQAIIIAADTIVVSPTGKILGKPCDQAEARRMLGSLAGKTHMVLTGYCVLKVSKDGKFKGLSRVVSTKVKMRKLTTKAIERYVETGEPMDKAGSYGAQGLGTALIESISGSYTNVVGLPVSQLLVDFEEHFDAKLFDWIGGK